MKDVSLDEMSYRAGSIGYTLFGWNVNNVIDKAKPLAVYYESLADRKKNMVDQVIGRKYGFFYPVDNVQYLIEMGIINEDTPRTTVIEKMIAHFNDVCTYHLNINADRYEHMFELLGLDYNAIENYNRVEESKTQHEGDDVTEKSYAERITTNEFDRVHMTTNQGERNQTTTNGAREDTDRFGEHVTDNTNGAQHTTNMEGIAGANAATYANRNRSESESDEYVDTTTSKSHDDVHSSKEYVDKNKVEAVEDESTTDSRTDKQHENARIDKDTLTHGEKITTASKVSGNIGVTTTQQMMQQEADFWKRFSLWDTIIREIIAQYCTYHDDGYNVMYPPGCNEMFDL